jgi:hypothetical protein
MDSTIMFEEVTALLGPTLPSLAPRHMFEIIRVLRRHLKRALQRLPCPQSTHLGWKGLVMLRRMYTLLAPNNAFCLPNNPGPATDYTRANPNNFALLTHMEQASVDAVFSCQRYYFQSLQNVEGACFTMLDASINN